MIADHKDKDPYENVVVMQDGMLIPIEDIVAITGEMFQAVEDSFA
jgi:hypothetical protein